MAFDNSGTKAVSAAKLGTTPKGVNCHFSSPQFDKPYGVGKLSISRLNMQFQHDWPKYKNYNFFNLLAENLEKFRSTEHYG